jgi:FtsH-binding integral membrane protein
MFWTWGKLKRVYIALAVIAAAAASAWFIALQVQAPDWVFSTVCVAAFAAWIAVGVVAVVRQASHNRRE